MAWAIFSREFNWSSPRAKFSYNCKPSPEPQERPHYVVDAAVAKGFATRVPSPTRDEKRALTERKTSRKPPTSPGDPAQSSSKMEI